MTDIDPTHSAHAIRAALREHMMSEDVIKRAHEAAGAFGAIYPYLTDDGQSEHTELDVIRAALRAALEAE